jgi:hypothetical protein
MLTARIASILFAASSLACQRSEDAQVVGTWQCNPRNGAIWRMTFTADHKLILALPAEDTVDANRRDAKFKFFMTGTWHIDGEDVVYTMEDKDHNIPKTTTRMKLAEFKHAVPFGTDREAYLERM